jgi:hypothetical protein
MIPGDLETTGGGVVRDSVGVYRPYERSASVSRLAAMTGERRVDAVRIAVG